MRTSVLSIVAVWSAVLATSPQSRTTSSRQKPILGSNPTPILNEHERMGINERFNVTLTVAEHPPNYALHYNPFVVDHHNTVYNIRAPTVFHGIARTRSVWIRKDGHVRHVLPDAEDARVIWLPRLGKYYSIFVRYRAHRMKDVWLARWGQTIHPEAQIKLRYAHRMPSEGNWMPFIYKDQLYVSYSLCPHTVLAVDPESGNCSFAYRTDSIAANCSSGEGVTRGTAARGNVVGFPVDGGKAMLGLGHVRGGGVGHSYFHFFYKRRSEPPFDIVARSSHFRFPMFLQTHYPKLGLRADATQFCISLRTNAKAEVVMDYSTMDAVALTLHVPHALYCNFTRWC
jgi:hypothetical protein